MILKLSKSYARARHSASAAGSGCKQAARSISSAQFSQLGSTILEAMIGTVIMTLVAGSVYSSFSFGFSTLKVAQENVRANQIMNEKLETLRVYNWTQLTTPNFFPANFTASYCPSNSTGTGTIYSGQISITDPGFSETYNDDLRLVTVTVTWNSGKVPESRSMTTLFSKDGLQNYDH